MPRKKCAREAALVPPLCRFAAKFAERLAKIIAPPTGDNPVGDAQTGSSLPAAIQDENLMPSQHGFGDDGTKAPKFYKADNGDDQMKRKRRGCRASRHCIKISQSAGIQADFVIRHRQGNQRKTLRKMPLTSYYAYCITIRILNSASI
jgi:hypothetical protein